jgi:hypothetical protein
LRARSRHAYVLAQAGRIPEAIAAAETLLADQNRALGADHADTRTTAERLAQWRAEAG